MIEVVTSFAAALAHPTWGVNAQLAALSLIGGHVAPPNIAGIVTSDDDQALVEGLKHETWPLIVLLDEDDGEWEPEVGTKHRDGDSRLTALYVPRDRDDALTYRNSSYTRRATTKTLRDWLANGSYEDRTVNSIYAIAAVGLKRRSMAEVIRDIPHAGGLTITLRVRDQAP